MLTNIGVLQGVSSKMNWLGQRQSVIAQNVANADTPKYLPRDLKEADFGAVMKNIQNKPTMRQAVTDEKHLVATGGNGKYDSMKQRTVYEAAPDGGNAVILEEQLFKSQKTTSDYTLMTNLYRKNINMLKIAIGKA